MVHQDRRKPGGIKRLQDNLEKREKVENGLERGKKVEEERCTGEEAGRGCCRGVMHGGGRWMRRAIGKKDGWEEVWVKVGREGRKTVMGRSGKGSGTEKNVKGERGVNRGDADLVRGERVERERKRTKE